MAKQINTTHATALWNDGLIDREIAEKLNCAVGTVHRWRKENDLPSNCGIKNWDPNGYTESHRRKREKERKGSVGVNENENGFAVLGTMRMIQEGNLTLIQATETVNMWIELTAKKFYSEGVLDELKRNNKSCPQRPQGHATSHLNDLGIDSYPER
jgi:hypothetical protein